MWALAVVALLVALFGAVRWQGQHRPAPMPVWLEAWFLANPLRRAVFAPRFVVGAAGLVKDASVGEIGTGIGVVTEALARAVGPAGHVYGIDRQPSAVAQARTRLQRAGLGARVSLEVADARRLPWGTASLDVVVLVAVLGEIPPFDRSRVLAEIARVLKPGGRLLIVEYWPDPHYLAPDAVVSLLAPDRFRVVGQKRALLQHSVLAEALRLDEETRRR